MGGHEYHSFDPQGADSGQFAKSKQCGRAEAGGRPVLLAVVMVLAGCAAMIRGTEQEIAVKTVPLGPRVQFSNGQG